MIENTNVLTTLLGTGFTTVFPSNIYGLVESQFTVSIGTLTDRGTEQVLDVDYTLSQLENEDGVVVTFASAPALGVVVWIARDTPAKQTTQFSASRAFNAEVLETLLDMLTMSIQEAQRTQGSILQAQAYANAAAASAAVLESMAQNTANSFVVGSAEYPAGTTFNLAFDPGAHKMLLTVNGLLEVYGVGYTVSGATVTFNEDLRVGDRVSYLVPRPIPYDPNLNRAEAFASRALLVMHIAANGYVTGQNYYDGTVWYSGDGGTDISDLPGLSPVGTWTPLHWGAVGDFLADDGVRLNAALAAYKAAVEVVPQKLGSIDFDGLGYVYRSTIPVIANEISSWGWSIRNLTIWSEAAGKNALELIGSRGGNLDSVMVYGAPAAMPRLGIVAARSATSAEEAFASQGVWDQVRTRGFFSLSPVYLYGAEANHFDGCEFWNSQFDAYCGIIAGYDVYPALSDHTATITGSTPEINVLYSRCEFRHLPARTALVSAISLTNPAVLTLSAARFEVGETIVIDGVSGLLAGLKNSINATVTAVSGLTITVDVDASAWSAYDGTGVKVFKAQTKATVLIGRLNGHVFDTCYCVNYGSHVAEIVWPDDTPIRNLEFRNLCVESSGIKSYFRFAVGDTKTQQLLGFKYTGYQGRALESFFSTDATGPARVQIHGLSLMLVSATGGSLWTPAPLVDDPSKYSCYSAYVTLPKDGMIDPDAFAAFRGILNIIATGDTTYWGPLDARTINAILLNATNVVLSGTISAAGGYLIKTEDWPAYAAQFVRGSAVNDPTQIVARGTGGISVTAVDAGPVRFATGNTNRWQINSAGALLPAADLTYGIGALAYRVGVAYIDDLRASSAIGFADGLGAGGTVTQLTSKTTGVTLNKITGQIALEATTSIPANSSVSFVATNSLIQTEHNILVTPVGTGAENYSASASITSNGSFRLRVRNETGGALAEAVTIQFTAIKGETS